MIIIAALYHFTDLHDCESWHQRLKDLCTDLKIKGILLLAPEGINGTIAGNRDAIDTLLSTLKSDNRFSELAHKESFADKMPFFRLKVRLKSEIVTMRMPEAKPSKIVGTYVDPKDWNAVISDPDVIVLDTRNDYEVKIGTFKGALNPKTDVFVEFPDYVRKNLDITKNKKVAMFCTGGIRCEKASAFMKYEGFEEVYHLKGGILKYLEDVPKEESLWEGECFVFDNRVSVNHDLMPGDHVSCYACRMPLSPEERLSEHYIEGIQCHYCHDVLTDKARKGNMERQRQVVLAAERHQQHIGATRHRA